MTPINFKGIYEFGFSGLLFGKMGLEIEQAPDHYAIAADIVSAGLMRMLVRHSSHTVVDATGHDFSYPTVDYDSHYQTRGKHHEVQMTYRDGLFKEERLVPPENPKKRPPVPDELKNHAADPLSFILRIRRSLQDALKSGHRSFSIDVYDGRRITEADFTVRGPRNIIYGNRPVSVIEVDARRQLIAGFTDSELADTDTQREGTLRMYFSDEAQLMPVRLEVGFMLGTLTATLVKECRTGESCLLGIRD